MNRGHPSPRTPARSRFAVSRLVLLILIGLCVLFVTTYSARLQHLSQVVAESEQWDQEIAEAKQRNAQLQAQLEQAESAENLDALARGELGLAIPGDTVIVVVEATPVPAVPVPPAVAAFDVGASAAPAPQPVRPVWRQWLDLLAAEE